MSFVSLEYLFTDFSISKYPKQTEKQKSNMKYRIKKGFDNVTCKIANEFKTFVEKHKETLDNENIKLSNQVKLDSMNDDEKQAYIYIQNQQKLKDLDNNIYILKKKFNRYIQNQMKILNITKEKIFQVLFKDDDCIKICDLDQQYLDNDNSIEHDGRMTLTLDYLIENDILFDEKFNILYKDLSEKLDFKMNYDEFIIVINKYYNYCRNEFEKNRIINSDNCRKIEISMMPKREKTDTYKMWLHKMADAGFYCGWCHSNYCGPIDDIDAWIFVGISIMKTLKRKRIEWSQSDKYKDKASFVELTLESNNDIVQYGLTGFMPWSINECQVNYMKKRFKNTFINLKLHQKLKTYGKE